MSDTSDGDQAPRIPAFHLAVRLVLELAGLAGLGMLGWELGDSGVVGGSVAALFVVVASVLWACFRTPGDPSGGKAIVATPGPARLALEVACFGLAAYGFWAAVSRTAAETFLTVIALHYAVTWERAAWLLRRR